MPIRIDYLSFLAKNMIENQLFYIHGRYRFDGNRFKKSFYARFRESESIMGANIESDDLESYIELFFISSNLN